MTARSRYVQRLLTRLREIRESKGVSPQQLEETLILGPGWIERFEAAQAWPSLDALVSILGALGSGLEGLVAGCLQHFSRSRCAARCTPSSRARILLIKFRYAQHDASYTLPRATEGEFNQVMRVLRDGLARLVEVGKEQREAQKATAVADSFFEAVRLWPHANPSDLWYLVIARGLLRPIQPSRRLLQFGFRTELETDRGLGAGGGIGSALRTPPSCTWHRPSHGPPRRRRDGCWQRRRLRTDWRRTRPTSC